MTINEFNLIASSFQSIAIAIAVFVGGIWALYRFFSVRSIEKAIAELEKLQKEMISRGVLEIRMEASVIHSLNGRILIDVYIKNVGSNEEVIDLTKSSVLLAPIDDASDENPCLTKEATATLHRIEAIPSFIVINPNEEKKESYITTGLKSSVYLIQANFMGSKREIGHQKSVATSSGLSADIVHWAASLCFDYKANRVAEDL